MLKGTRQRFSALIMVFAIVFTMVAIIAPQQVSALGTMYYVDSVNGSDSNNGTSTGTAWMTLTKVNSVTFQPGDRILFKAGCSWTGQLYPKGSGTSENPIIIDMYGTGDKPLIAGGGMVTNTFYLFNQQYWEISNLDITNAAATAGTRRGVYICAQDSGTMNHIYIKNLEVHNVKGDPNDKITGGIFFEILGTTVPTKWNDILVEGNYIYSTERTGLGTNSSWMNRGGRNDPLAGPWYASTNVVIRNNVLDNFTGDGMTIRVCEGALVEYNRCSRAAMKINWCGPFWAFNSDNTVFQYNEAYGAYNYNDGQAFDIDWNQDGTIYQYNYSHNNRGGAFLVCNAGTDSGAFVSNGIIRYNISQNDGISNSEVIHLSGYSTNIKIYNNTIYMDSASTAPVVRLSSGNGGYPNKPVFNNNIFYNLGSGGYVLAGTYTFDYNCFYGNHPGAPSDVHKVNTDPLLVNPGSGGDGIDFSDPNKLSGYKLQSGSPCIGAGIVVSNNGGKDFWGNTLYNGAPDIGAFEYQGAVPTPSPTPTPTPTPFGVICVNPGDDAYVRDGTYAGQNFGTSATMMVKADGTSYARKAYAKFDYSSFSEGTAASAKLRLYVDSVGTSATRTIKIYGTSNETWTESGITWSNAPAGSTYLTSINVTNTQGVWYEADVTGYVNSNMNDKVVSFLLVNEGANDSTGDVSFSTKESASNKTELTITAPGTTVNPVADSYVRNGTYAGQNFGTALTMMVKADGTSYARKAYAKFDYGSFSEGTAASAKLRLYVDSVGTSATRTIKIYGTSNETWTESGITWSNAPAGSTYLTSINVTNTQGVWYEADVTGYVNSNMSDKMVSFLLVNEGANDSTGDVSFSTKEASSYKPQLVIQ